VVKINWDVTLDIPNKKMKVRVGMGMVMRDELGVVSTSMAIVVPFIIIDSMVANAAAASKTIVFCSDLHFQRVIVEGDVLEIVNAFKEESPYDVSLQKLKKKKRRSK
jgi:hypothetical protein